MKKARKKRIVRRKRRISEREIMRIKRKLKKSARKLRLGAKRTGAYVYGTLRRIVGNPMRTHNKEGQKLYVVIVSGAPLKYQPPFRPGIIYYTKGWAIKKARVFGGKVMSVADYMKYQRDRLRGNRRRVVRGNPTTKARPIPGKFYRVYWSHPSRGETAPLIFKGEQLLKLSVSQLSGYWPLKEGLKMAKVHFRGPYDSWDDAFMDS